MKKETGDIFIIIFGVLFAVIFGVLMAIVPPCFGLPVILLTG